MPAIILKFFLGLNLPCKKTTIFLSTVSWGAEEPAGKIST